MMNRLFVTIALVCCCAFLSSCDEKQKEWRLVWEENFDQADSINEEVWSKIPRGNVDWNRHMSDYDSCYAMRDGYLVLRGLNNYTLAQDTSPVLTGGVYTKGKKLFENGRLEIKARLYGQKELGLLFGCFLKTHLGRRAEKLILWSDSIMIPSLTRRFIPIILRC